MKKERKKRASKDCYRDEDDTRPRWKEWEEEEEGSERGKKKRKKKKEFFYVETLFHLLYFHLRGE